MIFLTVLLCITLVFISILHFYWAFGGKWALIGAMPQNYRKNFFDPKYKILNVTATLVVAIGLLIFSYVIATNQIVSGIYFSSETYSLLSKVIGTIFLLRVIGDFQLFGLFKKKTNDVFSQLDSQIYIPLCLFLGIGSILVSVS